MLRVMRSTTIGLPLTYARLAPAFSPRLEPQAWRRLFQATSLAHLTRPGEPSNRDSLGDFYTGITTTALALDGGAIVS